MKPCLKQMSTTPILSHENGSRLPTVSILDRASRDANKSCASGMKIIPMYSMRNHILNLIYRSSSETVHGVNKNIHETSDN